MVGRAALWLALGIGAVLTLLPYVWMVSSSFKSNEEVFTAQIQVLPNRFRYENYVTAVTRESIARPLLNSFVMAAGETIGVLITSIFAGYAFARLRFWGRDAVFLIVLGTMMVPAQVTLIPTFILMRWLGWIDTYQGLIVPRIVAAFGIFMFRQFFQSVPAELEDAARIDGAGRLRSLLQIMLPLSGPALATLTIFSFTQSWNEFFWPLVVVQSSGMRTIQLAISALKQAELVEWGVVMAVVTISAMPTMLIYLVFQRYFVRGIALTGLKG